MKLANGAVLRSTDRAGIYYDDAHKMHYRKGDNGKFVALPDVRTMRKDGSWVDRHYKTHPATDVPKAGQLPQYNKPAAPAEKQGGPIMGNGGAPHKPVTISLNQTPRFGTTIADDIENAKNACKNAGRELSEAEQKRIDSCKSTLELNVCLNSMGIKTQIK